jgi:hypothetical protein
MDFNQPYRGAIEWDIDILPAAASREAVLFKPGDTLGWLRTRQPSTNAVRTADGETEGYLFYRGIGRFDPGLKTRVDAGETLHIGASLTRGLGSGSNPDLGRASAMEEYDRIKALLKGSDMVFITAGAGGGTGTGAAPVVARIARELGALTVGIVTKPFGFEGSRRREQADIGIEALRDEVDTLIVVPNNRLLSVLDKNTSMVEARRQVGFDTSRVFNQRLSSSSSLPVWRKCGFGALRFAM